MVSQTPDQQKTYKLLSQEEAWAEAYKLRDAIYKWTIKHEQAPDKNHCVKKSNILYIPTYYLLSNYMSTEMLSMEGWKM